MASDAEWLARCSWDRRLPEFGALTERKLEGGSCAVMAYAPRGNADDWLRTRLHWQSLPRLPQVIPIVDNVRGQPLLLRYAAIDWSFKLPKLGRDRALAARLGHHMIDLVDVFREATRFGGEYWLCRPRVLFDLEGEIQLVFEPPTVNDVPPESRTSRNIEEAGLVWLVGRTINNLVRDRRIKVPWFADCVSRCMHDDPTQRYENLYVLRSKLRAMIETWPTPSNTNAETWEQLQHGLGMLALGQPAHAAASFERANRLQPNSVAVEICRQAVAGIVPVGDIRPVQPGWSTRVRELAPPRKHTPPRGVDWSYANDDGRAREQARDFASALVLYRSVLRTDANCCDVDLALARCSLALHQPAAIDYAARVLAKQPANGVARTLHARGLLEAARYADALATVDAWIVHAPDDGPAVYLRGRALIGLGRLPEARDAFERASAVAPQLLEAQLLHREVERSMAAARVAVGEQPAVDAPVAGLSEAFAAGHTAAAITFLAERTGDPIAQLVLGGCLAFERRFDEALAVYERIAATWDAQRAAAIAGKARVLVELERAEEALASLASIDGADASDVRARALEQLGRSDEAAAEHSRVVSAAGRGAALRTQTLPER